jgi:hypothetical protein
MTNSDLAESLLEVNQMKAKARQRLRELHRLARQTDEEREEAWQLLRSVRRLATQNRRLRMRAAYLRFAG